MRLKNSIFLWAVPSAVIPLAILGFAATSWGERLYLQEADRELMASLDGAVSSIERRLQIERDVATGLSGVPAVRQYLPVLEALAEGRSHAQATARYERINRFFETFQTVRTSLDTVRILDLQGNSLVKVSDGHRSPPVYDGFGDLPFVEDEPDDDRFARSLGDLRPGEVSTLLLDGNRVTKGIGGVMPVYNTAVPLERAGKTLGYLAINPPLLPLNRILQFTPRVYNSELLVAEVDSDTASREGLVLFDVQRGIDLINTGESAARLRTLHPAIYNAAFVQSPTVFVSDTDGSRIYYRSLLPYPDRLVTWVIALKVRPEVLTAPFRNIRFGIIVSVLVALLLGLMLARAAARQIAGPVSTLAHGLADFTAGGRGYRVEPDGPDELQFAGRAFNDMAGALETAEQQRDQANAAQYRSRRLASLGQMAAGIAHEINNPINTILSLTTLIDRQLPVDAGAVRDDVRSIREETERIATTVRAILNFSREVEAEHTRFGAADWLRESVALAASERRLGDVDVVVTIHADCELEGDQRLLAHALLNLLENAAEVAPPGSNVTVTLAREGTAAVIEVLDEGPGLDDEQRDRAFDPFFTTKPEGVGSGLGLSITLGIVQHHGGSLELSNRPGGGAVARLLLPVAPIDRDAVKSAAVAPS